MIKKTVSQLENELDKELWSQTGKERKLKKWDSINISFSDVDTAVFLTAFLLKFDCVSPEPHKRLAWKASLSISITTGSSRPVLTVTVLWCICFWWNTSFYKCVGLHTESSSVLANWSINPEIRTDLLLSTTCELVNETDCWRAEYLTLQQQEAVAGLKQQCASDMELLVFIPKTLRQCNVKTRAGPEDR